MKKDQTMIIFDKAGEEILLRTIPVTSLGLYVCCSPSVTKQLNGALHSFRDCLYQLLCIRVSYHTLISTLINLQKIYTILTVC